MLHILNYVDPMLAVPMPTGSTVETYANGKWVLEQKFDGHRKIVAVDEDGGVTAWSRPGAGADALRFDLPDHISAAFSAFPVGTYDGELLVPGGYFADVVKLANAGKHVFVVFDLLRLLGQRITSEPYKTRRGYLEEIFSRDLGNGVVLLSAVYPVSQDAVDTIWSLGGEGAILKRVAATYRAGARSADWVKVKKLDTAVLTVIGYKPGRSGPYSSIKVRGDDGIETRVKNQDLAAMSANPDAYLGRKLVIEFTNRRSNGKYLNPHFDHWHTEAAEL